MPDNHNYCLGLNKEILYTINTSLMKLLPGAQPRTLRAIPI